MGIDLVIGGQSKKAKRTSLRSDDVYLKLLVKLYKFLVRGTGRKFNAVILKCLFMSKANKPPISLKRVINFMAGKDQKIELIVGTMTDDKRVYEVQAMNVTALRFTEMVRARIVKAGRECLTLGQLALRAPLAQNTVAMEPYVTSLGICCVDMRQLVRIHQQSHLGGRLPDFVRSFYSPESGRKLSFRGGGG